MIRSWWKKRNELLAIAACSCTFGAVMLEVGIYAAQHDLHSMTTKPDSQGIPSTLKSDGQEANSDTGPFTLFVSPEEESLQDKSNWELRQQLGQARILRELLIAKESKDASEKSVGDAE